MSGSFAVSFAEPTGTPYTNDEHLPDLTFMNKTSVLQVLAVTLLVMACSSRQPEGAHTAAVSVEPASAPGESPEEDEPAEDELYLVTVYIPGSYTPFERTERFADPLHERLVQLEIGEVSGGGTHLDPSGELTGSDVDVDLYDASDVDRVVELVRALGFPPGTRVQHDGGDVSVTTH